MLLDEPKRRSLEVKESDAPSFCERCALEHSCQGRETDRMVRQELHGLARQHGPFLAGTYLFREGDPFQSVSTVYLGSVKTFVVDACGREQVLGFFQPGEMIGLSAIHNGRYPCNAMALETVTLCTASFPAVAQLATRSPALQTQLFRLLSHGIRKASLMAGDFTADERVAAFLIMLRNHQIKVGGSTQQLDLAMSRADIASYLRLAAETVSRVMRRFQQDGLINVERRRVELLDIARLESLARVVLPS